MLTVFLIPLAAAIPIQKFWYAVPLIVSISLVYGATRHEYLHQILIHSLKSAIWVTGFMAIIFALIWFAGFWN